MVAIVWREMTVVWRETTVVYVTHNGVCGVGLCVHGFMNPMPS